MLYYVSYTDFTMRSHDVSGHVDYVKYIYENNDFPVRSTCWQCYHPPLYYLIVTPVYGLLKLANLNVEKGLQYTSVFFILIYLIFSYLTYKQIFKDIRSAGIALALTAFWPSLIIHAARIGNDSLLYMFYAIGFYGLTSWWYSNKNRDLLLALVCASLAVLTKSNGFILWGIIFAVMTIKFFSSKFKIKQIASKIWVAVPLAITLGLLYIKKLNDPYMKSWPIGNQDGLPEVLKIGASFHNFAYFDVVTFFKSPFIDAWNDTGGRQYFWNYLLKSSLFGEFSFNAVPIWITVC
ncbi:glycosyltransferase family 39 protein, partial [Candidatus Dojkabacteria bacterium]|nr:glycosyltransferase family 39 protein [Candidatus Dojkabacteria bacterium]